MKKFFVFCVMAMVCVMAMDGKVAGRGKVRVTVDAAVAQNMEFDRSEDLDEDFYFHSVRSDDGLLKVSVGVDDTRRVPKYVARFEFKNKRGERCRYVTYAPWIERVHALKMKDGRVMYVVYGKCRVDEYSEEAVVRGYMIKGNKVVEVDL